MLRYRAWALLLLLLVGQIELSFGAEGVHASAGCGPAEHPDPEIDVGRAHALRIHELRPAHGPLLARLDPAPASREPEPGPAGDTPVCVEQRILEALFSFLVALRAP